MISAAPTAPSAGSSPAGPGDARILPAMLSFTAGVIDVIGWMTLDGVFTAHITGNIVVVAADLARADASRLEQVLLLPVFMLAVVVADLLALGARLAKFDGMGLLLLVQGVLLIAVAVAGFVVEPSLDPRGPGAFAIAVLAVTAMASQNAFLHLACKSAPTASVMTGNVVVCVLSLMALLRREPAYPDARAHWRATYPLLAGFFAGCVLGAVVVCWVGDAAWIAPAVTALLAAVVHRTIRR